MVDGETNAPLVFNEVKVAHGPFKIHWFGLLYAESELNCNPDAENSIFCNEQFGLKSISYERIFAFMVSPTDTFTSNSSALRAVILGEFGF